jgi:Asp-tRNA(Asn)/Glu-tRNA(Gln) amidotransferase C subunit
MKWDLMAEKLTEIERSAEEIVETFVNTTKELPKTEETYYSQKTYNIMRADEQPTPTKELSEFRKRFISIMPSSDEEGNLKVEVARWVER